MQEAVADYRATAAERGSRQRREHAEVMAWFRSDVVSGPLCFVTICHALDLDPSSVRRALRR